MSISLQSLLVRSASEIPRKWNDLVAAVRSLTFRQGVGIRLFETPTGTVISAESQPAEAFSHAFQVSKSGDGVTVGFGVVNLIEPTIGGVYISGGDSGVAPVLPVKFKEGKQWIVLEVPITETLEIDEKGISVAAVEELKNEYSGSAKTYTARHPLALCVTKKGSTKLWQIEYFNLTQKSVKKADGTVQHFFYAQ